MCNGALQSAYRVFDTVQLHLHPAVSQSFCEMMDLEECVFVSFQRAVQVNFRNAATNPIVFNCHGTFLSTFQLSSRVSALSFGDSMLGGVSHIQVHHCVA